MQGRAPRSGELLEMRRGIAERLREAYLLLLGQGSGYVVARALEVPERTWAKWMAGGQIPAEKILRAIWIYRIEPAWLLRGTRPMFRSDDVSRPIEKPIVRRRRAPRRESPAAEPASRR